MTLPLFSKRTRILCFVLLSGINLANCITKSSVCTTLECRNLGNLYINNLDTSVNPCVNFYKYACAGWEKKCANSFHKVYWDTEEDIADNVHRRLRDILQSSTVPRETEFKQAKALYKVCMNRPFLDYTDSRSLMNIATKVAAWPILEPKTRQPNLIHPFRIYHRHYLAITGESAFFNLEIFADEKDYSKYVTEIRRPVTPFGVLFRITDWNVHEWAQYVRFLSEILKEIAPRYDRISKEVLFVQLTELRTFRDKLREICKKSLPITFETMTIQQFQSWYNKETGSKKSAAIDWLDLVRVIYKSERLENPQITPQSIVKIHKAYFSRLINLLAKTDIRVLVNHMHFYFAERHVKFNTEMKAALRGAYTDGPKASGKIVYEHNKWKVCIENHNMREVLGEMYVKEYFAQEIIDDVKKLAEEAKQVLIHQISNSNWLDNSTKTQSIDKARNIRSMIIASKGSGNAGLQNGGVVIYPTDIDIFYNLGLNRIYVTAANLQSPIYERTFPYPVIYGATMTSFGHELYHAFDQDGIHFNKYGNQPWWSKTARAQHAERVKCIAEYYNGYRKMEFTLHGVIQTEDTPSTTDEDFADLMGVKLAYMGYKDQFEKKGQVCATLPGFEDYSCDKLFFLAFANTFCTYESPNMKVKALMTDNHNLPEVRVNAALANMRQFSAAFNCAAGDPLRSSKPCDFWKK